MTETQGITTTGTAAISAPPDIARVEVGVSTLGKDAARAHEAAAVAMQTLTASLRDHGLADKDLRTSRITVAAEHEYKDGKQKPRGFRATNQLTATLRDLDQSGAIIDATVAAAGDVVTVHGIHFEIEERAQLERKALAAAFDDAKGRAQVLATAAGVQLGPVVRVTEGEAAPSFPRPMRSAMMMAESTPTPVEPGELEISAHVTVTWSIA